MKLSEIYKKTDYVRCPDGSRHEWKFDGTMGHESKTNRLVERRKCMKCGVTKKIFADTGARVNR